jgi:hypothetical protein
MGFQRLPIAATFGNRKRRAGIRRTHKGTPSA